MLPIYESSVSERLLRNVIVFFLAVVYEFDSIRVLSSGERLLSLLIGNEGFGFIDVITFTFSKSEMVSLILSVPHRCQNVRNDQEEKLGHVDNVQELGTVADIKPHPVSVRLQTHRLKTQKLQEV
jgi:hypothetical protein